MPTVAGALRWREAAEPMREGVAVTVEGCPGHASARLMDRWIPYGVAGDWRLSGLIFGHETVRDGDHATSGSVISVDRDRGRVFTRSGSAEGGVAVYIAGVADVASFRAVDRAVESVHGLDLLALIRGGYCAARHFHASCGAAMARAAMARAS